MASASRFNKQDLYDVSGLVAVVTGGSFCTFKRYDRCKLTTFRKGGSGLGLIIAQTLESNGAKVYITGRNEGRLREAVKTAVRHTAQNITFSGTI
jgi:NAD(P)-dependent dehydrogenase (short-subunit alcohol dehydrogenase family)